MIAFLIKIKNAIEWINCVRYFRDRYKIKWDNEIYGKLKGNDENFIKLNFLDDDVKNYIVIVPCKYKNIKDKVTMKFCRFHGNRSYEEFEIPLKMIIKRNWINYD